MTRDVPAVGPFMTSRTLPVVADVPFIDGALGCHSSVRQLPIPTTLAASARGGFSMEFKPHRRRHFAIAMLRALVVCPALVAQTPGSAAAKPAVADLAVGTIQLPPGWRQQRTGTLDSQMGEIAPADGRLLVHCDIGVMAGTHISADCQPYQKGQCIWLKEQQIRGHRVVVGLVFDRDRPRARPHRLRLRDQREITVPRELLGTVRTDEDVADVLLVALSYEGKP